MVRPRFENLDEQKQEEILQAAGEEFADHGYDRASLNKIIKRAGISKGSLYYYFEDKTDLFATVIAQATERFIKIAGGLDLDELTAETYWDKIEDLSHQGVKYLHSNTWYMRLSRSFYNLYAGGKPAGPARQVYEWAQNYQRKILARGQELGVVRVDMPLEYLLHISMSLGVAADQWLLEQWDNLTDNEIERYVLYQLDIYRRILSPSYGSEPHAQSKTFHNHSSQGDTE